MVHQNDLSGEHKTREQLIQELARANARIAELALELKSRNGEEKSNNENQVREQSSTCAMC